jgi:hypothetical protein
MEVEVTKEHRWLQELIGEWTSEMEVKMAPDQPPMKFTGKETVRAVGQVWVIAEGEGEMPGGENGYTVLTLGYDTQKKAYVGAWLGSMMTFMWNYAGEFDEAANKLTLNCEGPSCLPGSEGKLAKYKDCVQILDKDTRTFSGNVQSEDGQWVTLMTTTYKRVK